MADEKIKAGLGNADENKGTARGTYVGKADTKGASASGDGSMSTALQNLSGPKDAHEGEESMGDAAKRVKAAKAAKPAAKVPSYKKGTKRVPKTGTAKLHKNEAVLPVKKAKVYRKMSRKDMNGMMALFGKK